MQTFSPEPDSPTGRAPTTSERLLVSSVEELAPHKSLSAIESVAKFIFGSASIVGVVLTGLGVLGSTNAQGAGIAWALPSILAVAISLFLATLSLIPRVSAVRLGDQGELQRYFDRELRRRGLFVVTAGFAFAIAFPLASMPSVVAGLPRQPFLDISAALTLQDPQHAALKFVVSGDGFKPNSVLTVTAVTADGNAVNETQVVLIAIVSSDGTVTSDGNVTIASQNSVNIYGIVSDNGTPIMHKHIGLAAVGKKKTKLASVYMAPNVH